MNRIAAVCGPDVKTLLLSPAARLSRGKVLAWAQQPAERQHALAAELRFRGRLPRSWRIGGPAQTVTLPRAGPVMVQALLRRLGRVAATEIYEALREVLGDEPTPCRNRSDRTESMCETDPVSLVDPLGLRPRGQLVLSRQAAPPRTRGSAGGAGLTTK